MDGDDLSWLLPRRTRPVNPQALAYAERVGEEEDQVTGQREAFWTPDAVEHTAALQGPTPAGGAGPAPPRMPDTATPPATNPTNEMPPKPQTADGAWSNWVRQPGVSEFLISTGLQLMTGGWGNVGSQVAQALGHGFSSMSETQRMAQQRENGLAEDAARAQAPGRGRRSRARVRPRGGPRGLALVEGEEEGAVAPAPGARAAGQGVEARQMQAVSQFLQSNPTPEAWAQQNAPGGLINAVFGGPQDYGSRGQLLQLAQDRQVQAPAAAPSAPLRGPRGYPTLTPEEMIGLHGSTNPADRLRFQQEMSRILRRTPGVGKEWTLTPEGDITTRPMQGVEGGRGRGAARDTAFSQAAAGGIDAARLTIGNVRDYLASGLITPNDPTGLTGMAHRGVQQTTGIGDWARQMGSMKDAVMSYVHSRSGASVAVREFEHYMQTRMPVPGDSERTLQYKLADLELALSLIARRRGEPVNEQELLTMYNNTRRFSGLNPVTPEEFVTRLPALEQERGVRPGATNVPGVTTTPQGGGRTPAPTIAPPVSPAPAPAGTLPPGWKQEGDEFVAPDGTRIRRSR